LGARRAELRLLENWLKTHDKRCRPRADDKQLDEDLNAVIVRR